MLRSSAVARGLLLGRRIGAIDDGAENDLRLVARFARVSTHAGRSPATAPRSARVGSRCEGTTGQSVPTAALPPQHYAAARLRHAEAIKRRDPMGRARGSADSPALPDELFVARDEGGFYFSAEPAVSQANANLPGFLGLAEEILNRLRALPDSSTCLPPLSLRHRFESRDGAWSKRRQRAAQRGARNLHQSGKGVAQLKNQEERPGCGNRKDHQRGARNKIEA